MRDVSVAIAVLASLVAPRAVAAGPSTRPATVAPATTRPVLDRIPRTTVDVELVLVPAGRITLADDKGPPRTIDVKPFLIQRTEARWDEFDVLWYGLDLPEAQRTEEALRARWAAVVGPSRPYSPLDRGWGHAGSPIGSLQARAVQAYVAWLSKTTGHRYRLPTEAEWEYACRAGAAEPTKPTKAELDRLAWTADNSDEQTHPVARKAPNAWGLYDMLGNVAEWVVRPDGSFTTAGGSFEDDAADVHGGAREAYSPRWQKTDPADPKNRFLLSDGGHVGFRLVRDVEPAEGDRAGARRP